MTSIRIIEKDGKYHVVMVDRAGNPLTAHSLRLGGPFDTRSMAMAEAISAVAWYNLPLWVDASR